MGALEDLVASHLGGFSPEGGVHLPNTPGYDACLLAAGAANYACLHERRRPPVALQPARESDVVLAVRFVTAGIERGLWPEGGRVDGSPDGATACPSRCAAEGTPSCACARRGPHPLRPDGFRVVRPGGRTVTIAPGALLGAMNEAAQNHGLAVPTGVFAGVGVGSILAGGTDASRAPGALRAERRRHASRHRRRRNPRPGRGRRHERAREGHVVGVSRRRRGARRRHQRHAQSRAHRAPPSPTAAGSTLPSPTPPTPPRAYDESKRSPARFPRRRRWTCA